MMTLSLGELVCGPRRASFVVAGDIPTFYGSGSDSTEPLERFLISVGLTQPSINLLMNDVGIS